MRTGKWISFLSGLCAFALALGGMTTPSFAGITTEQGASVLIFPKVLANSQYDTIIQISNTGNSMVHAHCNYVSGLEEDNWNEIDFDIWLTKQQPTHWVVSEGRRFVANCEFGDSCAGFNPGLVPPREDFEGELKCVEVDESGAPVTGNHLKGVATIVSLQTVTNESTEDDMSIYNAIGILGNPDVVPGNPLVLDGNVYDACPEKLFLNHFAAGAEDPVFGGTMLTELTLVPCEQNFETQTPETVKIQFVIFNEFEQRFTNSTEVECYLNIELTGIDSFTTPENSVFSIDVLGTLTASATFTPVTQEDGSSGGLVGIYERRTLLGSSGATREAKNLITQGSFIPDDGPDTITLTFGF